MTSRFILPYADVGPGISPSDGALLNFYDSGTNIRRATWSDIGMTALNTNPVVADDNGVFPDIFIDGEYKVVLTDKNDVEQTTGEFDPVTSVINTFTETDPWTLSEDYDAPGSSTLIKADDYSNKLFTDAGTYTITIDNIATVGWDTDSEVWVSTNGGTLNILPGAGVTFLDLRNGSGGGIALNVQGQSGYLKMKSADLWSYYPVNDPTLIGGVVSLDDGTEASPSLRATNSTSTGVYFPAVGELAITLGGSDMADFTASGLTVSADVLAHRSGSSTRANVSVRNQDGGAILTTQSGTTRISSTDNAGGSEQAILSHSGVETNFFSPAGITPGLKITGDETQVVLRSSGFEPIAAENTDVAFLSGTFTGDTTMIGVPLVFENGLDPLLKSRIEGANLGSRETLSIYGGDDISTGARIEVYGSSDISRPNQITMTFGDPSLVSASLIVNGEKSVETWNLAGTATSRVATIDDIGGSTPNPTFETITLSNSVTPANEGIVQARPQAGRQVTEVFGKTSRQDGGWAEFYGEDDSTFPGRVNIGFGDIGGNSSIIIDADKSVKAYALDDSTISRVATIFDIPGAATPIAGYSASSIAYTRDAQATAASVLDISALAENSDITIRPTAGPTGTIWASLDDMPAGATSIQVALKFDINTVASSTSLNVWAVAKGETINTSDVQIVLDDEGLQTGGATTTIFRTYHVTIPIGTDNSFILRWNTSASTVFDAQMFLLGFTA